MEAGPGPVDRRFPAEAMGYTIVVANGTLPLTVQESPGRVRLCLGGLAHGDGPTLQDAADDLVQRLLTYVMAFRASGMRPRSNWACPICPPWTSSTSWARSPPPAATSAATCLADHRAAIA